MVAFSLTGDAVILDEDRPIQFVELRRPGLMEVVPGYKNHGQYSRPTYLRIVVGGKGTEPVESIGFFENREDELRKFAKAILAAVGE